MNPSYQNNSFIRKIALLIGIVILLVIGFAIFNALTNKGTLELKISPANATVTVDDKLIEGTQLKLKPGNHTVVVTSDKYLTQSQKVSVDSGKTTNLSITLKEKTPSNLAEKAITETNSYKISGGFHFTISEAKEFYDGNWVIAKIQTNSDPAIVILKESLDTSEYSVFMGPGTSFDQSDIDQLPPDVRASLENDGWL